MFYARCLKVGGFLADAIGQRDEIDGMYIASPRPYMVADEAERHKLPELPQKPQNKSADDSHGITP